MSHDLIIIGTGPGGYVCAIRAAQLGLKVAVVEKRKTHGGTCLNVGCIPSKAMLHATELFREAGHGFAEMGIKVGTPTLDLPAMMKHKQDTVDANVNGVAFLLKKNKIEAFHGHASLLAAEGGLNRVSVKAEDGSEQVLAARNVVIATGSEAASLPGIAIDEKTVVTSTGALELSKPPGRMLIIGAGVIGLELGSVWGRLGAEITVVEYLDRILPGMDSEVASQFQRILAKQGMSFHLSSKVTKVETGPNGAKVTVEPAAGGEATILDADIVLVAVGRRPNTDGLGLEALGVAMERGRITIGDHYETSMAGVFAVGDVVRGPMLAHKAEDEGVAVAEIIAGKAGHVNYGIIPGVVYTMPEVATLGATEDELKAAGTEYKVGKFPFTANGRARAMRATEGFVKVLADAATDRVLGAHIIGAGAGDLIHEVAVLMEFGGSSEDLARTCHAHPTLSEAVKEAALAVEKRALHV